MPHSLLNEQVLQTLAFQRDAWEDNCVSAISSAAKTMEIVVCALDDHCSGFTTSHHISPHLTTTCEANAQGAKPRFQGWMNPSDRRWKMFKTSIKVLQDTRATEKFIEHISCCCCMDVVIMWLLLNIFDSFWGLFAFVCVCFVQSPFCSYRRLLPLPPTHLRGGKLTSPAWSQASVSASSSFGRQDESRILVHER